ncbi:MAG: P-loop NTPase fold protein [Undibacterium sp.]|uniref:P-loop NTPase fold protein n=1 Tax=Undibacterium sp. TaxID=1914977 RepID=UPI0027189968|nr:P-loop NTPase fold protein [Undibacterium sp.]MDO8654588.1 P-loop NTPase fold protein [Undibacterium sp.]
MSIITIQNRVRQAEISVLIQTAILGFVFGEVWYLSSSIASTFNAYIESTNRQITALVICLITTVIGISYFYVRQGHLEIRRLIKSWRIDLLGIFIFGIFLSISIGGLGKEIYKEYFAKVPCFSLMLLVALPILIAFFLVLRAVTSIFFEVRKNTNDNSTPIFLGDRPIELKEHDLLGLNESAIRFAERVLNGAATESLVFGIDAPWGIGKSSFINFCCEYWKNKKTMEIIVHRFEPLRYPENVDLTDKFIGDLVNTIQKHVFAPSIKPLFTKYAHLIKGKNDFSFFGFKFAFDSGSDTVEDTLENLDAVLSELNHKIIIVVDDLDRLSWSAIKNILFAIKRSFMLSNVSYVLCYDTENIASTDKRNDDAEKVREFLEKFVNVKTSLFLDSNALAKYVSSNFDAAVKNNLLIDSRTLDQIKQAVEALVEIFNSDEFFRYQELIGDIRKLKRLINTLVLLEVEKTDFENSDFNKSDLIHLLLIYVNYPNIFRKIFNTEMNGKKGYFSLVRNFTDGVNRFQNSINYSSYVQNLNPNQEFLLSKIFDANTVFPDGDNNNEDELEYRTRACFNHDGFRNLERYLNLIINLSKPEQRDSYIFYLKNKTDFIQGRDLDLIFSAKQFSFSKGDFARDELWRIIVNSRNEFSKDLGPNTLRYLIKNIQHYSLLKREEIGAGSRKNLVYSLLKVLDSSAWGANLNTRRNNSVENILEIADWIFGEHTHADEGVIATLTRPERGVLGLYDLMIFRLYCSADRGGSFFNLHRALSIHSNANALTSGSMTEIAKEGMREISQMAFNIFKTRYILPEKNIFEEIKKLALQELAGECSGYIIERIENGDVNQEEIDLLISAEKYGIQSFVIYQLGNSVINSGIGCGFYDEEGNDNKKDIASKINDYLFSHCFNPEIDSGNFEHFLDYLLSQFSRSFGFDDGVKYLPNISELTKILQPERLKVYWETNKGAILERKFLSIKKNVTTSGYIASYESDLPSVYKMLDDFVAQEEMTQ